MSPGDRTDTDALDVAARQAHAASLQRLSPRVNAQLAQRRRAALAGSRPARTRPWGLMAAGSAAALVLAVGLFALRGDGDVASVPADGGIVAAPAPALPAPQTPQPDATAPAPAADAAAPTLAAEDPPTPPAPATDVVEVDALPETWLAAEFDAADAEASFAEFEETPDFYLWLGSDEDLAEFTESL
jgi:hypothetical protein